MKTEGKSEAHERRRLLGQFRTVVASLETLEVPRELHEAIRLVAPGGDIHVLRVVAKRGRGETAASHLREAFDTLRARTILWSTTNASVSIHAIRGDRAEETVRLAVECNADLIITGGFEHGSLEIASDIISLAACSVLVLEPNRERAETESLVPAFPVCPACTRVRRRGIDEWFCPDHQEPSRRLYERLGPLE